MRPFAAAVHRLDRLLDLGMRPLDRFLDHITMYRLLLYELLLTLGAAVGLSAVHVLPYQPLDIVLSTVFVLAVAWSVNTVISAVLRVPSMPESVLISALILALIIEPSQPLRNLGFLGWAAAWAMASKYLVAFRRKHLFNPAAFAVLVTSVALGQSASWWVASPALLPVVVVGGLLLVRKIQRVDMVWAFFLSVALTVLAFGVFGHIDLFSAASQLVLRSPLFFLAFVMLTEPATTPPRRRTQMLYGALVGVLFTPYVHVGHVFFSPEAALLIGNLFAYLVSYKARVELRLEEKRELAPDVWHFRFRPERKVGFLPGQYLEYTLPHDDADDRGMRRYFTIASSPTEPDLQVGVKFYREPSSYKRAMRRLEPDDTVLAGQLAGDFTLPRDPRRKLAFIAGGIGITPFRSILKYLIDTGQRRPIVVIYAVRSPKDVVYADVLEEAERRLGIRTVVVVSDEGPAATGWTGRTGFLTGALLREEIPDYTERLFYVSGPQQMVRSFEELLAGLGVDGGRLKTDYFPGFAA